jgi:hypothetical protein
LYVAEWTGGQTKLYLLPLLLLGIISMTWDAAALTPSSSPFHTITEPDHHGDDDEGNDPAAAAAVARGFAAGGGGVKVWLEQNGRIKRMPVW